MRFKRLTAAASALVMLGTAAGVPFPAGTAVFAVSSAVDAFLLSGTPNEYTKIYTGTDASFSMKGRAYTQGLVFDGESYQDSEITYDVSGLNELSFTMGHIDNTGLSSATFSFTLDGTLFEKVKLGHSDPLRDYVLDVSKASELTILLDRDGAGDYAITAVSTDGKDNNEFTVAKPATAEAFLKNGYDAENTTFLDGTGTVAPAKVNGKGYYQGILFSGDYSSVDSEISFNVENNKELHFSVGHVDNSGFNGGKLNIYCDNTLYETLNLDWMLPIQDYSLNVTDASNVRLQFDRNGGCQYLLGDFGFDAVNTVKSYDIPEYKTAEAFMKSGFQTLNTTVLDGTAKIAPIKINGRGYYQGLHFTGDYSSDDSDISFNVDTVSKLSFSIGHVDDSGFNNGSLMIYCDNELYDTVNLQWTGVIEQYDVDVSKNSVVRFVLDRAGGSGYALVDFKVDDMDTVKSFDTPEYDSAETFMKSGFGTVRADIYTGTTNNPAFKISGRSYYQGIVFTGDYSSDDSQISYNVENVNKISFTLGHVDGSGRNSATVKIYKDNELVDELPIDWMDEAGEVTIDVAKTDVLRIVVDRNGGSQYAFAEMKVDEYEPVKLFTPASYDTSELLIKGIFDEYNTEPQIGTSKNAAFKMNGRDYYQGLVMAGSYSGDDSGFTVSVETIDKLHFTIGHVDDSGFAKATLKLYLDNQLVDELPLTYSMNLQDYTLDTKDAVTFRAFLDREGGCGYALGDIYYEGSASVKPAEIPVYEDSVAMIKAGFDLSNATAYDGTSPKIKNFNIGGNTYAEGMALSGSYASDDSTVSFNVENADSVSFKVGQIDGQNGGETTLTIYLDGVIAKEVILSDGMELTEISLDTKGAERLWIYADRKSGSGYAIVDLSFTAAAVTGTTATTSTSKTTTSTTTTTKTTEDTSDSSSTTTTTTTTVPSADTPGDVNGDGKVNLCDLVIMRRELAGGWKQAFVQSNADFDGDGEFGIGDVVALRRYFAGYAKAAL